VSSGAAKLVKKINVYNVLRQFALENYEVHS